MKRRFLPLLVLVLLLTPSVLPPLPALAQSMPKIGLGFGPLSIQPLKAGIPVLTQGDNLWAQSYDNSTTMSLFLNSPNGTVTRSVDLAPDGLVRVYTFSLSDPSGTWLLVVYIQGSTTAFVNLPVVNGKSIEAPSLSGASLRSGSVALAYSVPSTSAYNIQACLMGATEDSGSSLQLPPSIGGTMQVALNGSRISASAPSSRAPFEAWFELYTSRSYVNGTTLISDQPLAARTQAVALGGATGPLWTQFGTELNLRDGRYELRSYVRNTSGLTTFDTPYLKANDSSWVSLGGCSRLTDVTSGTFEISASLNDTAISWPRRLVTMYDLQGVDSFAVSKVPTMEARIDIGNATQARALATVGAAISGSGIQSWEALGRSVYLIGTSFPITASVRLSFENVTSETIGITIPGPYWIGTIPISTGTLEIKTLSQGSRLANATVEVSIQGSPGAPIRTNGSGVASLALPAGNYNISFAYQGRSGSTVAHVSSGGASIAILDLGAQGYPLLFYFLGAVLVAGIGLNLVVWRAYFERRATLR